MRLLSLLVIATVAATSIEAQTPQDAQRLERHIDTHGLTPEGGNCVVSFTLNSAGSFTALDLSKCAAKDQAGALTRLAAALPFPASSTVSREVSIRL